jgi:hypothetical protein
MSTRINRWILLTWIVTVGFTLACDQPEIPFVLYDADTDCRLVVSSETHRLISSYPHNESFIWAAVEAGEPDSLILTAWSALECYRVLNQMNPSEEMINIVSDDTISSGSIVGIGADVDHPRVRPFQTVWRERISERVSDTRPTGFLDSFHDENGDVLIIAGETALGTLYAVYDVLDRLGVQWLTPDPATTVVPHTQNVVLPALARRVAPVFYRRGFTHHPDYQESISELPRREQRAFWLWMVRNRLNVWHTEETIADSVPHMLGIHFPKTLRSSENKGVPPAESRPESWIWNPDPIAHCKDQIHNFMDSTRTEWFRQTVQEAERLAQAHERPVRLRLEDIPAAGEWPERGQSPVSLECIISPGFRCFNHGLGDPVCEELNQILWARMQRWIASADPYRCYLELPLNNPSFCDLPTIWTAVFGHDLQTAHQLHLDGVFLANIRLREPGIQALSHYLFAKQAWDPGVRVDSLKSLFIQEYYRPEARLMTDFMDKLEEAVANMSAWHCELAARVDDLSESPGDSLLPLPVLGQHFQLEHMYALENEGTDWERTFQLVWELRNIMNQIMNKPLPEPTLVRLMQIEDRLPYLHWTVMLYDNVIRLMTLSADEPAMREESAIRLRDVIKDLRNLDQETVFKDCTNGLRASGLAMAVKRLLAQNPRSYERIYADPNDD